MLTTLVDWAVSFALFHIGVNHHIADTAAWICAVLFAFVTNRILVFSSERKGFAPIVCEFAAFAGGRVLTLLLQEGIMFLFVDLLNLNKYFVKISAAVLVVFINFFLSKIIFKKKRFRKKPKKA